MDITYRATLIRARVKRREAKGIVATADDVSAWIKTCWPDASDEDQERIFQASA